MSSFPIRAGSHKKSLKITRTPTVWVIFLTDLNQNSHFNLIY